MGPHGVAAIAVLVAVATTTILLLVEANIVEVVTFCDNGGETAVISRLWK